MNPELARKIVAEVERKGFGRLTEEEAMKMTRIESDNHIEVYAIQKGDVTYIAWGGETTKLKVKHLFW